MHGRAGVATEYDLLHRELADEYREKAITMAYIPFRCQARFLQPAFSRRCIAGPPSVDLECTRNPDRRSVMFPAIEHTTSRTTTEETRACPHRHLAQQQALRGREEHRGHAGDNPLQLARPYGHMCEGDPWSALFDHEARVTRHQGPHPSWQGVRRAVLHDLEALRGGTDPAANVPQRPLRYLRIPGPMPQGGYRSG